MLNKAAEDSFEKGLRALGKTEWRAATAFFEAAITLESQAKRTTPQARYRSYYGLCLGLAKKRHVDGIALCQSAIDLEHYNPDMHWNLGKVFFDCGRKREAYRAFVRGLKIQPGHKGLVSDMKRMGLRTKPVIPFLSRSNPINRTLGRMRSGGGRRRIA